MQNKAIFYHAGCPVCLAAEHQVLDMVDRSRFQVEVVHLGTSKQRVQEAKNKGVKSVPALVVGNDVLHINFGAGIEALG
jgi:glutaredoxin 3